MIGCLCCKRNQTKFDYYILSKVDSVRNGWKYKSNSDQPIPDPPPPPPPTNIRWYSNVVMIFDTDNKVYIYQTERNLGINNKNGRWYYEYQSIRNPHFIGLNPSQLVTLNSNYLIDFLKDNDVYFKLDTNYHEAFRFLQIVSDFDTIKNKGFYKLLDFIKQDITTKNRLIYNIRRATEEEHNVLSCKRIGKFYDPKDFNWTNKFLNGAVKPLTKEYDSIENISPFIVKSKETFKPEALNTKPIK